MIRPFDDYIRENMVRKTQSNISMAKAMIEKSEIRLKKTIKQKITEEESSITFEDIYESLREAIQSIMEIKGYKPYSHEAVIAFMQEEKILSQSEINIINNYRILRNDSVYLARQVSLEKCLEAVNFAKKTLPKIRNIFRNLTKK